MKIMKSVKTSFLACACSFVLVLGWLGLAAIPVQAMTETVKPFFTFACDSTGKVCPNGSTPSRLIQSADDNFYGATLMGGTGNRAAGTVFRLSPSGELTTLYTFVADASGNYPNGANPGGVVEGNDGFLYGSTVAGGPSNNGVVFRLSKTGTFKILHAGGGVSVVGRDGNLYGFGTDSSGNPALVRITPTGSLQVMQTLSLRITGVYFAGLFLGSDGNLYGTTIDAESGKITSLFRLSPSGQFRVLQTIHYGQFLVSAPIQSENGNIYAGLDFVVQPNGALLPGLLEEDLSATAFHLITLAYAPQQWMGEIIEASDGNFWGARAGTFNPMTNGAVVSFTHAGAAVQQIDLGGYGLMQASDGRILGLNGNQIFALEPALPAPKPLFVTASRPSGAVGSTVTIYGSHFVGTTRVAFNGVSATFKVLNSGNIVALVPLGATTGPIEVTNAGGTGTSAKSFVVP